MMETNEKHCGENCPTLLSDVHVKSK